MATAVLCARTGGAGMTQGGTDSPGTCLMPGESAPWAARCRRRLQAPLPGQGRVGSASHAARQEEREDPRGARGGAVPTGAHPPRVPRVLPRAPQHPPLGAALGSPRAPGEARPARRSRGVLGPAQRAGLCRQDPAVLPHPNGPGEAKEGRKAASEQGAEAKATHQP